MADRTPYDGQTIYMGGQDWVIPGLSVRQFRTHFLALAKNPKIPEGASLEETERLLNESLDEKLPIVLAAMQRNYPDLTEERLLDMLDVVNMPRIVGYISSGSALRPAKPGE
jgi:hypothetical protein